MRIAVLDTGIDGLHRDLGAKIETTLARSFVGGSQSWRDEHGHGTHVSGIAGAGTDNDEGIAGIMWSSRLVPVRVLGRNGRSTATSVAEGITYAVTLARRTPQPTVVNLSLGLSRREMWDYMQSHPNQFQEELKKYRRAEDLPDDMLYEPDEQRAVVEAAREPKLLLVGAAGNDGDDFVSYPAAFPELISVGALDRDGRRTAFSNYGEKADVVAPGQDIESTTPTNEVYISCGDSQSKTIWRDGRLVPCFDSNYDTMDGTSMAAPHVSGVAGLIWAKDPSLSNLQVMKRLLSSAEKLAGMGGKNRTDEYGYGLVNARRALTHDQWPPIVTLSAPLPAPISASGNMLEIQGTAMDDLHDRGFEGRRQQLNEIPSSNVVKIEYRLDNGTWQRVAEYLPEQGDKRLSGTARASGWPWDNTVRGGDKLREPKTYETNFAFLVDVGSVAPGEHTIEVRGEDSAGNWSKPDSQARLRFELPRRLFATTVTELVIDVSGSMGDRTKDGTKIDGAKRAALDLLRLVGGEREASGIPHKAGIVSFSDEAKVEIPLASNLDEAMARVRDLRPLRLTNVGAGLTLASAELRREGGGAKPVVVLLSDGMITAGMKNPEVLSGPVRQLVDSGACIYTVGFGERGDLDEVLLKQIAEASGCGNYSYARTGFELENAYVQLRHESTGDIVKKTAGIVRQGEKTEIESFRIGPRQGELYATLNWAGSLLEFTLRDPAGRVVDKNYPGATVNADAKPVYLIVKEPRTGQWSASVYGKDVPKGSTEYSAIFSTRELEVPPGNATPVPLLIGLLLLGAFAVVVSQRKSFLPPIATVTVSRGSQMGRAFAVRSSRVTIGSSPRSGIALSDHTVSSSHARIELTKGSFILSDLNSATGTFLNNTRITIAQVLDGDQIRVGDTTLLFRRKR